MKPILFLIFSFIYIANCHSQSVSNLQNHLPSNTIDNDPIHQHADSVLLINNNIRSSGLSLDSSIVFNLNPQNQTLFQAEIYKYEYDFHGNRKSIISLTPGDSTYAYFNSNNQLDSTINFNRYSTHVDTTIHLYYYDSVNILEKIERIETYGNRNYYGYFTSYYFDSNSNLIQKETSHVYDTGLKMVYKEFHTFTPFNNTLNSLYLRWDFNLSSWVNKIKYDYVYTSSNKIDSIIRHDWSYSKWNFYGSKSYTYNNLGLLIEYLALGDFAIGSAHIYYEYDTYNNLTKSTGYRYNNDKNILMLNTSLPNGLILTNKWFEWENNNRVNKYSSKFQYNSNNEIIEQSTLSSPYPNDTTGYKTNTVYDTIGNWKEKHYFDYQNSMWLETEFENNVFDLSISTQQLILPEQSPFFNKIDTNNSYYGHYSNGQFFLAKFEAFYYSDFALSVVNPKVNLFKVYPNPATENIQIKITDKTSLSIRVFDQTGKIVLRNRLTEYNNKVSISHLTQGVYYILIESEKFTETHKLIKL